jgi:hypothetical protein
MSEHYDSTNDTLEHQQKVRAIMGRVETMIGTRLSEHDASKLLPPEKEMYDVWRPILNALDIESDDYKQAIIGMGNVLKHHYAVNRHHPEHFENGINGMTLIDLIEMICDWSAASKRKDPNGRVNMLWACDRFGIGDQLSSIIQNTLKEIE